MPCLLICTGQWNGEGKRHGLGVVSDDPLLLCLVCVRRSVEVWIGVMWWGFDEGVGPVGRRSSDRCKHFFTVVTHAVGIK